MRVEVEVIETDLVKRVYQFMLLDNARQLRLVLDEYQRQERQTRRHGYEVTECYYRLDRRRMGTLKRNKVVIPAFVRDQAMEKACSLIQACNLIQWSDE